MCSAWEQGCELISVLLSLHPAITWRRCFCGHSSFHFEPCISFVFLGRVEPTLVIDLDRCSFLQPAPRVADSIPLQCLIRCPHVPQATTTVYVTVLDENDNAPAFQQQLYEVTLDEGPATLNATLVTVQALDQDDGPNGTVAYAITEGNILGTFHINSTTVSKDASPSWVCPSPAPFIPASLPSPCRDRSAQ